MLSPNVQIPRPVFPLCSAPHQALERAIGDEGKAISDGGTVFCINFADLPNDVDDDSDDGGKQQRKQVQLKVVVVVNQQYPPTKVTNVALATV